jgi:phosphatidylserine/phosphatidylglycerophosphate/cardiolipin synthase-like enzyme
MTKKIILIAVLWIVATLAQQQLFAQKGIYPVQTNITPTSFTLNWLDNAQIKGAFWYKDNTPPTWINSTTDDNKRYALQLGNLAPATVYWVQMATITGKDTLLSTAIPYSTQSLSTGEIKVFFNHSIDNQFVGSKLPTGTSGTECLNEIINRINNAQQTIDVALYNNNRTDITTALKNAKTRGVQVRYIAAAATLNSALTPAPAFPVVFGNTDNLMHNKFMIVDANLVNDTWVMAGSMNWTTSNINSDYNNMLMIQDQALAKAYEMEFNEMWGSTVEMPNAANQKFGNTKTNNTPHQFVIGGIPVECWFSPSDQVTDQIVATLNTANSTVDFGLLTFTKNEPSNVLVSKFTNSNVAVRGLIENINDSGSEFAYLQSKGISVAAHTWPNQMHHKYAVIDPMLPNSDPTVWTGSHNWTFTAENFNDENSLVIHDSDIARLYLAEFEARITENPVATTAPQQVGFRLQPNPTEDQFMVVSDQFDLSKDTKIQVWSSSGALLLEQLFNPGQAISTSNLPDGSYIVKIKSRNGFAALPLQKISR